jgi:hypothetical protein
VIPEYLGAAAPGELGIEGVEVTHIWCDDPAEAEKVAKAACIPNVVAEAEDVIGRVDAVVIPTDKGWEHVDRARPFVEAALPVFIDKPLTDREDQLRQFVAWQREGKAILSTSAMRYAREYVDLRGRTEKVGEIRLITNTTPKSWERYGIHALEGVYPFLPAGGWRWVANTGEENANIVHIRHECGADVVLAAITDMYGGFGFLNLHGTNPTLRKRRTTIKDKRIRPLTTATIINCFLILTASLTDRPIRISPIFVPE